MVVGASDGTGRSKRSLDDDARVGDGRTGDCAGTGAKRLGLAWKSFEACGVEIAADAGSSFNDKPFMYCDMSLAMLCCRKSSLRCRGD